LKDPEQRQTFHELCRSADVLVENYRRGVPERLGVDYETVRRINPRLVYASISGFGDSGPRREEAAYDSVMQAFVGIMHMTGNPGGPPARASVSVCDVGAGMYANQAILLALLARERTGRGQRVESSMFEAQVAWMLFRAVGYFATGNVPKGRMGTASAHLAPYEAYPTADGHIMVAALNDRLYQRMMVAMGLPDMAEDSRFARNRDRVAHRDVLNGRLRERFLSQPTQHWYDVLRGAGVPCSPVNTIEDALLDPQTAAREMIMTMDHPALGEIRMPGIPIKMSDTPGEGRLPPPMLDQHREEILTEIGVSGARR
ncbi:MAG: CoA transferase, partial [Acetobacterales bacterium]